MEQPPPDVKKEVPTQVGDPTLIPDLSKWDKGEGTHLYAMNKINNVSEGPKGEDGRRFISERPTLVEAHLVPTSSMSWKQFQKYSEHEFDVKSKAVSMPIYNIAKDNVSAPCEKVLKNDMIEQRQRLEVHSTCYLLFLLSNNCIFQAKVSKIEAEDQAAREAEAFEHEHLEVSLFAFFKVQNNSYSIAYCCRHPYSMQRPALGSSSTKSGVIWVKRVPRNTRSVFSERHRQQLRSLCHCILTIQSVGHLQQPPYQWLRKFS